MDMDGLKFDNMEVDTKLAQEFLLKHQEQLEEFNKNGTAGKFNDDRVNLTHREKLTILADKVKENAELFAQIEALKRGLPKNDVKHYDINIIVQTLKHYSRKKYLFHSTSPHVIPMYGDTPLYALVLNVISSDCVTVFDDNTLPSCFLFALLGAEAGIPVIFDHRGAYNRPYSDMPERLWAGSTAVVCESADVDSAVEALLLSPAQAPWTLRRIYVQESIYDKFKTALTWKCGLKLGTTPANNFSEGDRFTYENKKIFFDYFDSINVKKDGDQIIFVEAYRTVKEVLGLIEKHPPHILSLWSSDVAESHEVAFSVKTPLVWVNDFGTIVGPDRVSSVFLRMIPHLISSDGIVTARSDYNFVTNLCPENAKIHADWSKMTIADRIAKFRTVLEEFKSEKEPDSGNLVKQIMDRLSDVPSNKFVEIDNGKMWIGVDEPRLFSYDMKEEFDCIQLLDIVYAVITGSSAVLLSLQSREEEKYVPDCSSNIVRKMLRFFNEKELPFFKDTNILDKPLLTFETHCVCMNYGTIFAN